jgi:hypothetical protein
VLAVTIKGNDVGNFAVACESNAGAQGRGLAAIFWQLQTSSSGSPRDLRRTVTGSIVDDHNLCNMLPSALHNVCDVRSFVESRN